VLTLSKISEEIAKLKEEISKLHDVRNLLGAEVVDLKINALEEQLRTLVEINGGSYIAGNVDTSGGDFVGRDKVTAEAGSVINTGTTIIYNDKTSRDRSSSVEANRRYLDYLIDSNRHLRLQGIRSGGQPLSVDLENVFISLSVIERIQRLVPVSEANRNNKLNQTDNKSSGFQILKVADVLSKFRRCVVVGDPGCGKTTLFSYLAITYARDRRDSLGLVFQRLGQNESSYLPILIPLRDFGHFLKNEHPDLSLDGPGLLLDYIHEYYNNQVIRLPVDFFSKELENKNAIVLLDGLDEVADPNLRQRVARIVEKFAFRYPENRFLVSSREVGYDGPSRIGAEFALAKILEFTPKEIRQFIYNWTRAIETTLSGSSSQNILRMADEEADHLIRSVESNRNIGELAINPLLLTVIALVHRYRAALPERRSELYEEAIEVLLSRWDEAKGLDNKVIIGRKLDAGDRRAILEPVALWMHEQRRREIELPELHSLLKPYFAYSDQSDDKTTAKLSDDFLNMINERSGLLIERGVGIYSFAHLTFQEYLAARAITDREDNLSYTIEKVGDPWWREVILLEAGCLSTQGRRRVSELIRAILHSDQRSSGISFSSLILAAECVYDVGNARLETGLLQEIKEQLLKEINTTIDVDLGKAERQRLVFQKVEASNTLGQIERGQFIFSSQYWQAPWGEPYYVHVPQSEYSLMEDESESTVIVPEFLIAQTPITNAQYELYVGDTSAKAPASWRGEHPPKNKLNHPVEGISWLEAQEYCVWLSTKINQSVRLPTVFEWREAAFGSSDARAYPWGDEWQDFYCNSRELGLNDTTPVDIFRNGSSPYGCLDMIGNVWEWCATTQDGSNIDPTDLLDSVIEKVIQDDHQELCGGAFSSSRDSLATDCIDYLNPKLRCRFIGFRIVKAQL